MNLSISGRHMDVTDAIRGHVEQGLAKIRGHFDRVIDVEVILGMEKHRQIAEINLHANGLRINAKEASTDLYASFDAALEKIDRQIAKHKSRIMRHHPRTNKEARTFNHHVIRLPEEMSDNGRQEAPAPNHHVIHREKLSMKPMSIEEAALQLDLLEDPFIVFANADTDQVNVMYKRGDGAYGVIEPSY